ncbi:MAG: DUF3592 domain-containing protein [Peptococcaceae bacterium]|nr:DUF3592 domain-containing protein [Peptococcaceae bacterium]
MSFKARVIITLIGTIFSFVFSIAILALGQGQGLTHDQTLGLGLGVMILGVIMIFVGSIGNGLSNIFAFMFGHNKKLKSGPLVIGRIISVKRTGMLINHQPQLEIEIQFTTTDGRQITTSDKRIVELHNLAQVQPGEMVSLRYNPENPQKIMIEEVGCNESQQQAQSPEVRIHTQQVPQDVLGILNTVGLGSLFGAMGGSTQGTMQASIVSAVPTGRSADGKNEVVVTLRVNRPDGSIFDAQVTKSVLPGMMQHFSPGRVVQVVSLTGDEKNLSILITMPGSSTTTYTT